ncbi:NAD+ synthase [Rubellicoccus peritrichatus]|uniref:Glutamine-dependent NAD(+) synthetase n=1 Tax=Rubellicoccus peritrichatus TaxID=3080537 RepID=A0AAQ3QUP0_9BACT|nr:NAD+ synthase [Puniceicoccus sp. CR14]WOO39962.1 NAD+ synthase [Puniceicoccus sp. CR14]
MKIGLAQINTTVGDLHGNAQKIVEAYGKLRDDGADLIIFPELALVGYPPRDLLFKSRFISDVEVALKELAKEITAVPAIIGTVETNRGEDGRRAYNSAAWCEDGQVKAIARKCLLPTYDVFDEDRYFEPAPEPTVFDWEGKRIGITICEDMWNHPAVPTRRHYKADPVSFMAEAKVDLIVNLSASPWHFGKNLFRKGLLADAANRCKCPIVYCNLVGGNDELIFDGHSKIVGRDGELVAGLAAFREELTVVDLAMDKPFMDPTYHQEPIADIHDALVLGLRDYAHKSGFRKALIGLSGGIDSAVVAALATEAFGPENVIGISLPSAISSQHSRDDARILAENLGIRFETLSIASIVDSAVDSLGGIFSGLESDVTEENIQARARGLLLMAVSNKFGALLLTTGNKSEVAVGYCTLYGDMAGGLAVISDLPKMQVYELARFMNKDGERVPENTITKPPSAELRPDQVDQDSLPPYEILDEILRLYVEEGLSRSEIAERGFQGSVVDDIIRKVDLNEYKRKQAAPGLKITSLAFGVGRRIPIVQKYVG